MKEPNDDIGRLQSGGRRRVFGHGGLRLVILQLIADKPRHGYELIKAIEDRLAGRYSPSPGVVYPTLTLLEELGLIAAEAAGSGTRRSFAATPSGREHLSAHRQDVDALFARMDAPGGGHGLRPPPVVRAIENLKLALRMRLGRTPLTDAQAYAIAAVLDDASQRLERIQ